MNYERSAFVINLDALSKFSVHILGDAKIINNLKTVILGVNDLINTFILDI